MELVELNLEENQAYLKAALDQDLEMKLSRQPPASKSFSQAIFVDGHWAAGAIGAINYQTFHLSLLATRREFQRQGFGAVLLEAAEKFALAAGCHLMTINTQDFQSRPFYERHGFEVFAELADAPFIGTTRYYLRKYLRPDAE